MSRKPKQGWEVTHHQKSKKKKKKNTQPTILAWARNQQQEIQQASNQQSQVQQWRRASSQRDNRIQRQLQGLTVECLPFGSTLGDKQQTLGGNCIRI